MTSCAAAKKRPFIPRPELCETAKNPGRCKELPPPELPPRTCEFSHVALSDEPGDFGDYFVKACCEALPEGEDVTIVVVLESNNVEDISPIKNCAEEPEDGFYQNPPNEGDYTMTATFTWSDTGTCVKELNIHVEEEDENDD